MLARIFKFTFRLLLLILALSAGILLLPSLITTLYARTRIYSAADVPAAPAAIVFGAGLTRDGAPTAVLRDRVSTAASLYFSGKVEKLLMSGDNRFIYYNEPGAMKAYALELGVPEADIVLDYAGRRTYDTCYRAREIFGLQQAILVTQSYHLPRAVYTCNRLGLPAVGVPSDLREYRRRAWTFWSLREIPATLIALWEVHFAQPLPVLGDPEPIFPLGN